MFTSVKGLKFAGSFVSGKREGYGEAEMPDGGWYKVAPQPPYGKPFRRAFCRCPAPAVSGWYGRRDETCPLSTRGRGEGGRGACRRRGARIAAVVNGRAISDCNRASTLTTSRTGAGTGAPPPYCSPYRSRYRGSLKPSRKRGARAYAARRA